MPSITERFKNAWNAFSGRDPTKAFTNYGYGTSYRPDRSVAIFNNDRSIIKAISNRIAMDVAAITVEHVRVDEDKNYKETINSSLNECLVTSANIDQTGRAFIQDAVMSMFDEGVVALVPTEINLPDDVKDPDYTSSYEILSIRTAKILEWYPQHVKVRLYNERTGRREDIVVGKAYTAIVENPLYSIMNEPNSTLQRLMRTYNDLDMLNKQNSSGKLDLIIQLPYLVKTPQRMQQAESRRNLIEQQLMGSKYGIAYIDGTEKITQLNRPVENNLWNQAKELEQMLYNQLGLTQSVFDGTANEATMLNYYNRTIEPILGAFTDEMKRKFLSKKARGMGQSIIYFRDPFRLVPVGQLADIADKFTRNAILSPNELRSEIGYKPDQNPESSELRNRNLNQSAEEMGAEGMLPEAMGEEGLPQEGQAEDGANVEDARLTADDILEMINEISK